MHLFSQEKATRTPVRLAIPTFVLGSLLLALFSSVTVAEDDDEVWARESLSGSHHKQQFLAGERVEVNNATIDDDIFAAGNDLDFDTVVAKMIVAAGATLHFRDIKVSDLVLAAGASLRFEDFEAGEMILAGGELSISGQVKDDVVAAVCPVCPFHGRLHLKERAQIGDDARLAGREVIVDGRIGGNLYAAAQRVEVSGHVAGNARIEAERVILGPTARISGNLQYASPNELEMRDGAVVAGQIKRVEPHIPFEREGPKHPVLIGFLVVLGFLLALIILGIALQLAIPGILSGSAAAISTEFWSCLGRGLVIALLAPAIAALLMASVIGAPIGFLIGASLVLLYAMAFVAVSYRVGLYVRHLFGTKKAATGAGPTILWTSVGILIFVIIGVIPLIGWAIGLLAIICGLGAVVSQLGPVFRRSNAAPA